MTRKPAPGANPISHRRNRCRSSRSMPSTTTRMARGQSRSVIMAPRSPARRRTVSSKRRACVLSMFSHIAGNEAKHKSVFHGTEPHPNCWTSVSGMQSETAIWHASSRLWSTIPLSNAFANGASKSRTARPLPTMPRSIQAVATLPTMPLPKTQAQCRHIGGNNSTGTSGTDAVADNPLELVESGWSVSQQGYVSYAFALRNTSTTLQVQYPEVAITGEPKTAPSCSRRRKR